MNTDSLSNLDIAAEASITSQGAQYAIDKFINVFLNTEFFTVFEDESRPLLIADQNTKHFQLTLFQSELELKDYLKKTKGIIKKIYGDEVIRLYHNYRISYMTQDKILEFGASYIALTLDSLTTETAFSVSNFRLDNNAAESAQSTIFDRYKINIDNISNETRCQSLLNSYVYVPLKPQAAIDDPSRRDFFIINKTLHVDSNHVAIFDRRDRLQKWSEINNIECQSVRMPITMLLWYIKLDEGILLNYNQPYPLYYRPDDLFIMRKQCNITEYTFTPKQSYFYLTLPEAAEIGNLKAVEYHVENGIPLNTCIENKYGNMAIHLAAMKGHLPIVRYLISNGCPPDVKQNFNWQPIHFACYHGHPQLVDFLIKINASLSEPHGYGYMPIHLAAEMGHQDIIIKLLNAGVKVDVVQANEFASTPLHLAASNNHSDIVQTLLSAGADVNYRDKYGWSALMHAANWGHKEIVKLLIQNGAQKNYQDMGSHHTAANLASNAGYHDVAQLIEQPLHVV